MRIIAGTARGMRLHAPKGMEIRPTLDRVRESLFNIIGPEIAGARFLDLFSGTGANGIEALSRGAAEAHFVDGDTQALALLQKNLEQTRLGANARVHKLLLPKGLCRLGGGFGWVFADPPYSFSEYDELLSALQENGLLIEGASVCLEHDHRSTLPESVGTLRLGRQKKYGDTVLSFYA